jgi:hypothetical protein
MTSGSYINEFLLGEDPKSLSEGIGDVDEFFGDWFIRKGVKSSGLGSRGVPRKA